MHLSTFLKRIIRILFKPKSEWKVISVENPEPVFLFKYYVLPLLVLNILAGILSLGLGKELITGTSLVIRIISAAVTPVLNILISTYVLYTFAGSFRSSKDFTRALQLVVFSYIPVFIIHYINYLFPFTDLWLFGIYGFVIMWFGLSEILQTPDHKKPTYLLILIITLAIIWLIIGTIIQFLLPDY